MKTTPILISVLLALLFGGAIDPSSALSAESSRVHTVGADLPPEPDTPSSVDFDPIVDIAGTPEQVLFASEAIARFVDAGLQLPPLEIGFHDHRSGCRGHKGVFRMVDRRGEIEICGSTRHLLYHELAHAWEAAHMSDRTRDAVMEYWDVDNWNDHGQPVGARGAEKVADAIAFALERIPAQPNPTLRKSLCSLPLVVGVYLPATENLDC